MKQAYPHILKSIILALAAIIFTPQHIGAQIYATDSKRPFNADSLRRELDNGPYFTLYKDNYFSAGTSVGERITRTNSDVKFQISIAQRLTRSTLPLQTYLFLMYNQKCFWNVFEESLPMRDLNFNPGIGFTRLLIVKDRLVGKATLLIEHESNGRDGLASRSWNRITFGANVFVDPNLMLHCKTWIPIIDSDNNRDILNYCGVYQMGLVALSTNKRFSASVLLTKRKGWDFNFNTTVELSYRIFNRDNQSIFMQYYNGYGEGLLDYNRFHSRVRVGIVIKPQFFSEY